MTGLERLLCIFVAAGIAAVALWLFYRTSVFGQHFKWDEMPRSEVLLVRCGRTGIYLFLLPVVVTFSALTALLAIDKSEQWFAVLAICAGLASCVGISMSVICSVLARRLRRN